MQVDADPCRSASHGGARGQLLGRAGPDRQAGSPQDLRKWRSLTPKIQLESDGNTKTCNALSYSVRVWDILGYWDMLDMWDICVMCRLLWASRSWVCHARVNGKVKKLREFCFGPRA